MPLLTVDPTKNVCPSYDGEDHEFVRVAIIASHVGDPLTIEAAIAKLQDAWKRANDKRVTQWNEQLEEEQRGNRTKHVNWRKRWNKGNYSWRRKRKREGRRSRRRNLR
jgi:hypothetical protein